MNRTGVAGLRTAARRRQASGGGCLRILSSAFVYSHPLSNCLQCNDTRMSLAANDFEVFLCREIRQSISPWRQRRSDPAATASTRTASAPAIWRPPAFPGIPVIWRWRHCTAGGPDNPHKYRCERDFSVERMPVIMTANGEQLAGGSRCAVAQEPAIDAIQPYQVSRTKRRETMPTSPKLWRTYEKVATEILDRLSHG